MSDSIKRLSTLRNLYNSQNGVSKSDAVHELKLIKNELKLSNDQNARDNMTINDTTNSPYLSDQPFHNKDTFYNSPKETDWKEVRSYEENRQRALVFKNLKKLNII